MARGKLIIKEGILNHS